MLVRYLVLILIYFIIFAAYLHGRLAVMPGMVCCTKFKTQFEPLLLIKRGLGSNGIILDIEGT